MTTVTSFPLTTVALTDLTIVRSAGYAYTWSTAVTSTDPGDGTINADNATFASITALYLSETDADANNLSSLLATWDDSTSTIKGELRIYNPLDPDSIMTFSVTARTDNVTYDTLTVTPLSNNGTFADGDDLRLEFRAKGDAGDAADIAATTHAATSKTTPVDADELPLVDSAASNGLKKLTWANLKVVVAAYLSDSAPTTLDTLNELANALGDDPNFATTTATALGNRLRFDAAQSLTTGQKTQAQANLGLADMADCIEFVIDGGGSAITTGVKGDIEIPYNCTITRVTMLADQTGSAVVNLWVDTYANFPPTVADKITASAPPTISSASKSQDTTLTGWTTSLTSGSILRYNVDSASTVTRVTVSLKVTRTSMS